MQQSPNFHDDFMFPTEEAKLITFHIGVCCVNWASLDVWLGNLLGLYMKIPLGKRELPMGLVDMREKCRLIGALTALYKSPDHIKLEKILSLIDIKWRHIRNRYVHDNYEFFTGDHLRIIHKTRVKKIQSYEREIVTRTKLQVSSAELIQFNNDLSTCIAFLGTLFIGTDMRERGRKPTPIFERGHGDNWKKMKEIFKRYADRKIEGE